jgi:mannose-6-phosphate isomerase-like protein (cupin superfamily)
MNVRNYRNANFFTTKDGSRICELYGIPTTKESDVSLAYAIINVGQRTDRHSHTFKEIYVVVKGSGIMWMDGEEQDVCEGDSIMIPAGSSHDIKNTGQENLCIYCICVPSYTDDGTKIDTGR